MAIKESQPGNYITFTYKGEPVQSIKYLCINVPSTNKWHVCYESRLQAGWNSYYILNNRCNHYDTRGWEVTLMLFTVMVSQVLLYGKYRVVLSL